MNFTPPPFRQQAHCTILKHCWELYTEHGEDLVFEFFFLSFIVDDGLHCFCFIALPLLLRRCQFPITIGDRGVESLSLCLIPYVCLCVCVHVHKCFCAVRKGEWNQRQGGGWRLVISAQPPVTTSYVGCSWPLQWPPACLELCALQTTLAFCLVTYVACVDRCTQRIPYSLAVSLPLEALQLSLQITFCMTCTTYLA